MINNNIIIHKIMVKQNPNIYVITEFVRDELFIYFRIYDNSNEVGVFHVKGLIYLKHDRTTKTFLYPINFENNELGYYYEIQPSNLVETIINSNHYSNKLNYKHFVFENYKYWIEVVALDVDFKIKKLNKKIKKLWKKVC